MNANLDENSFLLQCLFCCDLKPKDNQANYIEGKLITKNHHVL